MPGVGHCGMSSSHTTVRGSLIELRHWESQMNSLYGYDLEHGREMAVYQFGLADQRCFD